MTTTAAPFTFTNRGRQAAAPEGRSVLHVNGVEVTVYGGVVPTYALSGHVTGWTRRNGARTTYAELTCTCHLSAELVSPEGEGTWTTFGEPGWQERLALQALAHVQNVTANAFWVRPAGGDRSRWSDRHRVNAQGLFTEMQEHGLRYSELMGHLEDIKAGHIVHAEDGTRFELARDRAPYVREPLPIH